MNEPLLPQNEDDVYTYGNYHKIIEESPVPMYIFDLQSLEFLEVNKAALVQYGYEKAEFLTLLATQIRPKEEVNSLKVAIQDFHHTYYDFGNWKHLRKNGETFFVHIYAHGTIYKGRKAQFVMAIDIDQKVEAQKELLEKNAEIEDILESITDGFYAMNEKWEVTYINKEAERILACKREDLIGRNIWEFFPDVKESAIYAEFERAMQQKVSSHFETLLAPLGVWASISIYPKKDGLSVYFVDITTQQKHTQMIEKQNEQLKKISWLQSHEVRAPLSNILGLIQLLNKDGLPDNEQLEIIKLLNNAATKLDGVVKNISDQANIEE
ncbi:PAS domain S-box protein [Pedobacter frigiditerrae]|uniref:PAS domain-containing protein n=1 Tax=Pedobacter frigiditerrae TaxID=2530452 RepID=UPI00292D5920|nr:PAS domain S-box protein [Pedobacter frigiditerrae]